MDGEELYWETGIPHRRPYRKYFRGWQAASANADWWAAAKRDVYISVYGYGKITENGSSYGYDRNLMPDYESVVVDKIFLDFDYHDPTFPHEEYMETVQRVMSWLDNENYRRRWIFSGGGMHLLIRADGNKRKLDSAIIHIITKIAKGSSVDPGAFDVERMRRYPNSYNRKRGCYCINITEREACLPIKDLKVLASKPRKGTFPEGRETYNIDSVEMQSAALEKLGKFTKKVVTEDTQKVLYDYGLDWEYDFCPAMQYIIDSDNPGNFERMQLLKYIRSVLRVPFVEATDENKTVLNLVFNLFNNKKKAVHCVKMAEAQSVYKRQRVFHPQKLRALGYCPRTCNQCLERRQDV